jgi:hypothetical protein
MAKDSPLASLPASGLRFSFFSLTDAVATAAGAPGLGKALSALDALFLDRLANGWRPNVFVKQVKRSIKDRE